MTTVRNNVCYFQSGGPTQVINSSFYGLYKAFKNDLSHGKFYVSRYGVNGLLNGKLELIPSNRNFKDLLVTPGAFCGSARIKLTDDFSSPVRQSILKTLDEYQIGYLFVNGGNDSMDSASLIGKRVKKAKRDVKVIGIPKTIDNDLGYTDHCPGFGSAAKFVANSVITIGKDDLSYEKGRINIIETRGRDSGFLAASSLLAKKKGITPDFIFVPEVIFDVNEFLSKATSVFDKKGHCLVVVSEGIRDKNGNLIVSQKAKDSFGNTQVGGVADYLSSLVSQKGYKTRGIELSLLNRAATFVPSLTDIKEASACGEKAYLFAKKGRSGVRVTRERAESSSYKINFSSVPLDKVANKEKKLPLSYLSKNKDNIKDSYRDYVSPLIKGERNPFDPDGLVSVYCK